MWSNVFDNPEALKIFDTESSLERVFLSQLLLDRNGPTVTFTMLLRDIP